MINIYEKNETSGTKQERLAALDEATRRLLPDDILQYVIGDFMDDTEADKAMKRACQLDKHRRRSKFDVAIKLHNIKGVCRYDVWKEWESQGCPPISAEWIRELLANRYVEFVFEDLSAFNQLKASADKHWVMPRLYKDPILDCAHRCSRY